jgi:hypothetical protein
MYKDSMSLIDVYSKGMQSPVRIYSPMDPNWQFLNR